MERTILAQLEDWKSAPRRKPLLLQGARQVGKTWILQEFARCDFTDSVYINFLENREIRSVFQKTIETQSVIQALELRYSKEIGPSTLLIFDEIQECSDALTALKFFCENRPDIPLVAAGSLLGVALHAQASFPVGKVDHLFMYPMSFYEFLLAENPPLAKALKTQDPALIGTFEEGLTDALKRYYFIGGMPEAVAMHLETGDMAAARDVQNRILFDYEHDFSKYATPLLSERIRMLWDSVPQQLGRENKKFVYSAIKRGARARGYEEAIQWLVDAGLLLRVRRVKKAGIPLSAYKDRDAFKLYVLDVGLLGAMSHVSAKTLLDGNNLFTEFKGALTENYACQELRALGGLQPNYWSSDQSAGEVDFVYEADGTVIPLEVKADINLRSKSLKSFVTRSQVTRGYRLSLASFEEQDWVTNIPLYAPLFLPGMAL